MKKESGKILEERGERKVERDYYASDKKKEFLAELLCGR